MLLCFWPFAGIAQPDSAAGPPAVQYFNEVSGYDIPDTSLNYFHYMPKGGQDFFAGTGNTFSVSRSMVFAWPTDLGFETGLRFMENQLVKPGEMNYYHVRKPYTKLHYVMASKEEQSIDALHTQNVSPQFNIGARLRKGSAIGFFERQKASVTNLSWQNSYFSRNNRYGLLANALYNQLSQQENGGLFDDTLFLEDPTGIDFGSRNVQLLAADNQTKAKSIYLNHFMNFGKQQAITLPGDTSSTQMVRPFARLSHRFEFRNQWFRYRDEAPDSLFYSNLFPYTGQENVFDSAFYRKYENTVMFSALPRKFSKGHLNDFALSAWGRHQYIAYCQWDILQLMRNYIGGAALQLGRKDSMFYRGTAEYIFEGANLGDYSYTSFFQYSPGNWSLNARAFYELKTPEFQQTRYASYYLNWQKQFKKVQPLGLELGASHVPGKFWLQLSATRVNQYIYFDENALPQQVSGRVEIYRASAGKQFDLSKLHLKAALHWQNVQGEQVVRLPVIMAFTGLWYENMLFKKKLQARLGADIRWNSLYKADAWMPLTGQFHLQNARLTGNYPFCDVYAAIKIKRARLYFKVAHVNQGLTGTRYFIVPRYPMAERTFRLGINWVFFD